MKKIIWNLTSFLISSLPLTAIRLISAYSALFVISRSKRTQNRLLDNLRKTKICPEGQVESFAKNTLKHLGMMLGESAYIAWRHNDKRINSLIESTEGLELIDSYLEKKHPIVFITPHTGNFEVAIKYFYNRFKSMDLTVIYKQNKNNFLEELVYNGRKENRINLVKATKSGAVALIRALKQNKTIGILPDNVASSGDGVWIDFFGVPVYATTLAAKMIISEIKPKAILVSCLRTKNGFKIKAEEFIPESYADYIVVVKQIYAMIEKIILESPEQFYWSYDRFRVPKLAANKYV